MHDGIALLQGFAQEGLVAEVARHGLDRKMCDARRPGSGVHEGSYGDPGLMKTFTHPCPDETGGASDENTSRRNHDRTPSQGLDIRTAPRYASSTRLTAFDPSRPETFGFRPVTTASRKS